MSTEKRPPKREQELTENDADRLIYEAFRAEGAFVPQTPEEVARAEAEFNEESVELPASLRDPLAILKGLNAPKSTPRRSPHVDPSTVDGLACAARNGGEIPPTVEEKMDQDEAAADEESKNGEK